MKWLYLIYLITHISIPIDLEIQESMDLFYSSMVFGFLAHGPMTVVTYKFVVWNNEWLIKNTRWTAKLYLLHQSCNSLPKSTPFSSISLTSLIFVFAWKQWPWGLKRDVCSSPWLTCPQTGSLREKKNLYFTRYIYQNQKRGWLVFSPPPHF